MTRSLNTDVMLTNTNTNDDDNKGPLGYAWQFGWTVLYRLSNQAQKPKRTLPERLHSPRPEYALELFIALTQTDVCTTLEPSRV